MTTILCDTNIFIHYFNGKPDVVSEFNRIGLENILMPSVVTMELFRGGDNKNRMAWMKKRVKYFNQFQITESISRKAVGFIETYRLSHDLKIPDALIGAMAVVHQLLLFTYNVKDFRYIPGIILHQTT